MNFKPTFLYIKQHSETGKMYFGKTVKNPEKYQGSGVYWQRHIRKHGIEKVETLWFCLFLDLETLQEFSLNFSKINNINTSDNWANYIYETGLDGGSLPKEGNGTFGKPSPLRGRPQSQNHKDKSVKSRLETYKLRGGGPKPSEDHKAKISDTLSGRTLSKEHCENISKGQLGSKRSEETKIKISEAVSGENNGMFGKTHSEEVKQKWKNEQRNVGIKNGMFGKTGENNPQFGKPRTEKQKTQAEKTKERLIGKPQQLSICPHCGKKGGHMIMNRWHFDKCKIKNEG